MALKHFGSGRGSWKDSERLPEAFRVGQIEASAGNVFCPQNLKLDQSAPILKSHLRAKKSRCQPHRVISSKTFFPPPFIAVTCILKCWKLAFLVCDKYWSDANMVKSWENVQCVYVCFKTQWWVVRISLKNNITKKLHAKNLWPSDNFFFYKLLQDRNWERRKCSWMKFYLQGSDT